MEKFEQDVLAYYDTGIDATPPDVILFWYRKADDTITAIHNDHITPFFTYINSIHPDIKWTKKVEADGKIAMLDVSISRSTNGTVSFDVYREPTHTNQYIQFESHAPLSHKYDTIHSLTRRANLISSTEEKNKANTCKLRTRHTFWLRIT